MNVDEETRARLTWLTEDVPGGPDLAGVVREGRRRRRRRRMIGGVAATAVVGLAAGTALQLAQGPDRQVAVDDPGFAADPSYPDFVAGTQVDEHFQATVSDHLTTLPTATDVYPSDWNTDGPLPDAQFANATDWQAVYDLGPDQQLTVLMAKKTPGQREGTRCHPDDAQGGSGQPNCVTYVVPGGVVVSDSYQIDLTQGRVFTFITTFTRDDGSQVVAMDRVKAMSWEAAEQQVAFSPDQLRPLVTDDALDFPDPVVTPPPPSGR